MADEPWSGLLGSDLQGHRAGFTKHAGHSQVGVGVHQSSPWRALRLNVFR